MNWLLYINKRRRSPNKRREVVKRILHSRVERWKVALTLSELAGEEGAGASSLSSVVCFVPYLHLSTILPDTTKLLLDEGSALIAEGYKENIVASAIRDIISHLYQKQDLFSHGMPTADIIKWRDPVPRAYRCLYRVFRAQGWDAMYEKRVLYVPWDATADEDLDIRQEGGIPLVAFIPRFGLLSFLGHHIFNYGLRERVETLEPQWWEEMIPKLPERHFANIIIFGAYRTVANCLEVSGKALSKYLPDDSFLYLMCPVGKVAIVGVGQVSYDAVSTWAIFIFAPDGKIYTLTTKEGKIAEAVNEMKDAITPLAAIKGLCRIADNVSATNILFSELKSLGVQV